MFLFGGLSIPTAVLGVWQIHRYQWKRDLIDDECKHFENNIKHVDSEDAKWHEKLNSLQGQRVSIQGRYNHSKEIFLGLRSAPHLSGGRRAQGMATNPMGYFVITPLEFDNGKCVFVNRGWIPKGWLDFSRPEGNITEVGVVQNMEKRTAFSPENYPAEGRLLWLSAGDLMAAYRRGEAGQVLGHAQDSEVNECPVIIERLVEDDEAKEEKGYPVAKSLNEFSDSHYITPEVHLSYAFTWFFLSATAVAIAVMSYRKRGKGIGRMRRGPR